MAAPSNIVGIARQQTVFVVKETIKGVLAYPAAAAPYLQLAGYIDINQTPTFTDSDDVRNTRDILGQFQDMTGAGAFSMPMYVRPAGSLGVAPMGDVVFESLFGLKTINAGVSVVYSPALTKPSYSLWAMKGHTMFFAAGVAAETLRMSAANKGGVKMDIGGSFFQMGWAGRDAVKTLAAISATTVPIYDAAKYTIGAVIYNVTKNDKATNGYTVTGVDPVADTITVSPGLTMAWAVDDIIQPYLPAGTAPSGAPLESRKTTITFGGVTKTLISLDLNYDDKVKMLDDEMTTSGYPGDYVENTRKITGTAKSYFRQNDMQQWLDGYTGTNTAVVATFGSVAGSKLLVGMPTAKPQVPKVTTSAPTMQGSLDLTAIGNVGEDSISFTFA